MFDTWKVKKQISQYIGPKQKEENNMEEAKSRRIQSIFRDPHKLYQMQKFTERLLSTVCDFRAQAKAWLKSRLDNMEWENLGIFDMN